MLGPGTCWDLAFRLEKVQYRKMKRNRLLSSDSCTKDTNKFHHFQHHSKRWMVDGVVCTKFGSFDYAIIIARYLLFALRCCFFPSFSLAFDSEKMPLPSHLINSAVVLDNVIKTMKDPYVMGIGGLIRVLVEVITISIVQTSIATNPFATDRHWMYE